MGRRLYARKLNGQFKQSNLTDWGFRASELATGKMTCANCMHVFMPILKKGYCPQCGSADKVENEKD
jgi:uncharacterized OB-fold protein